MSVRLAPILAVLTVALCGSASAQLQPAAAARSPQAPSSAGQLISALDACIQKRFREIDGTFGMRRIVRLDDTPHVFRPEQTAEWDAVQNLDRAGLQVVLYVTGRRVLAADGGLPARDARGWSIVKGPVEITRGGPMGAGAPQAAGLVDASRRAFDPTPRGEPYEFSSEGWRFIARPVRASQPACLTCHNRGASSELRLGDALGVVLYGYRAR